MHMSGNKWINHVEMLEIRRRHIGGVDGLGNGCKRGSGHVCKPCSERKRKYCINTQQKAIYDTMHVATAAAATACGMHEHSCTTN
jgi:hypothetical protein